MKESKRVDLWREFRKFLYDIGMFRQDKRYASVVQLALDYIHKLATYQGLTKNESERWYVGYFQEIAWFVVDNPRNEKIEWDDGCSYDLESFRKAQLKFYGEKSEIKEWVDGE